MMKLQLPVLGLFLAVVGMAQMAAASVGVQANDDLYLELWSKAPSGQAEGPFHAAVYDDDSRIQAVGSLVGTGTTQEASFLTFCVEHNNYFWASGQRFNIDALDTVTQDSGKRLTGYTAWVYSKFLALNIDPSTSLAGTALGGLSWATAMNDYQNAIWAGMVGASGVVGGSDSELSLASFTKLGGYTDYYTLGIGYGQFLADTSWTGANEAAKLSNVGNYRVLVIVPRVEYGTGYNFGQDQVFFLGTGDQVVLNPVPEPTTLAIWGLGLGVAGAAALRRRKEPRGRWSEENRQAIFAVIEGKR